MHLFRILLLPFSWIYCAVTAIRNKMFDFGILRSQEYDIPIISVGNITVGGTGKTPVTEFLLGLLQASKRCATLSRGYGRKTKGVIISDANASYQSIGDEPMQMKLKFPSVCVAVAEKRREGMEKLLALPDSPQVVILDDAFQHRYVKPGLSIVVIDYNRPVRKDFCLPAGNLRESVSGLNRADVILINKSPEDLSRSEADSIRSKLKLSSHQQLFFSSISYKEPVCMSAQNTESFKSRIKENNKLLVAVAGIGNPEPFFESLKQYKLPLETLSFRDHHSYGIADLRKIEKLGQQTDSLRPEIITTEKDAIRIASIRGLSESLKNRLWYVPISLNFIFNEQNLFEEKVIDYVEKYN
ncbi:MAG: tetraacyldisaccharide 4'-kinase [Bacteroidales bacterium]|nr:tetraacyldisaccharide 4'-kinase [Bacteroidales bacterium]